MGCADPSLSGLKVGQSARSIALGSTMTGPDGCFRVPSTARWASAAATDGALDLRVQIRRPDSLEMRVVPVAVSAVGSDAPRVTARTGTSPAGAGSPTLDMFTGSETVVAPTAAAYVGQVTGSRRVTSTTPASASAFVSGSAVPQRAQGTKWKLVRDYGKRPVVVGQWWSTTRGVKQTWTYSKGASSALGAAYKLAGEGSSYTHSETDSTSTDATVGFPTSKGRAGKLYRSYFEYGKYTYWEYDYIAGKWIYLGTWVQRTAWERGTQVTSGVPVPATTRGNCSPYLAGSHDTSNTSKAMTWIDGVDLSATMKDVLGSITLSSQTGFTARAQNDVQFTRNGRLCGVYGKLDKPGALVARLAR